MQQHNAQAAARAITTQADLGHPRRPGRAEQACERAEPAPAYPGQAPAVEPTAGQVPLAALPPGVDGRGPRLAGRVLRQREYALLRERYEHEGLVLGSVAEFLALEPFSGHAPSNHLGFMKATVCADEQL